MKILYIDKDAPAKYMKSWNEFKLKCDTCN